MLDFIKDIFAAFRQNSLERMKSPFLGAFVFSWLGFNWQLLAILFFSKKEVEERILFINQNFDIGGLLLGPACTTLLICILLPQATKYIIKLQSKPISAATLTTMTEKISLAARQLEIADIESKKRLSDKREERRIEEGIEAIKAENTRLKDIIDEQSESIKNINAALNDTSHQAKVSSNQISNLIEQSENLQKSNKDKDEKISQLTAANVRLESAVMIRDADLNSFAKILETLRSRVPALFLESSYSDSSPTLNESSLQVFEDISASLMKKSKQKDQNP